MVGLWSSPVTDVADCRIKRLVGVGYRGFSSSPRRLGFLAGFSVGGEHLRGERSPVGHVVAVVASPIPNRLPLLALGSPTPSCPAGPVQPPAAAGVGSPTPSC